jgi:malate permease and related proteins
VTAFEIFLVVIQPIAKTTGVVLFAYIVFRRNWLSARVHGWMSKTVLYVTLPMLLFAKLAKASDLLARYPRWYILPISAWCIYSTGALIGLGIGWLVLRRREDRAICSVMCGFHNAGYLPLVVVTGVFGEVANLDVLVMIFVIGAATLLWSAGPVIMGGGRLHVANLRKVFNPPIIAVLCGLGAMLLGLGPWLEGFPLGQQNLGFWILTPLELIGQCAIPLILMVLGGMLAKLPGAAWKNRRFVSTLVLVKLVIMPILAIIIIPRLGLDPHLALVLMVQAMMPPALNLSVQSREFGTAEAEALVGEGLFFAYLGSVVTLTVFLTILKMMGNVG